MEMKELLEIVEQKKLIYHICYNQLELADMDHA